MTAARASRAARAPAAAFVAPALIVLATALVYLPSLRNGFVNWDDEANLLHNPSYRGLGPAQIRWAFTTFHMGHYQPLAWLSLGADFAVWGMNPAGYHLTSLLLHLANTALVYLLALRLLAGARPAPPSAPPTDAGGRARPIAAAFAAGLFALHPLRVESVAWATERRDVLSGLFFLIATLAHVAAVDATDARARRARRALSLASFALALLSKSITVTLPALLLVLDVVPLRRARRGERAAALVREKIPYLVLSLAISALAVRAQRSTQFLPSLAEVGAVERAGIAVWALAFYLWKSVVPAGLTPTHTLPIGAAARYLGLAGSAALVAGATALAWRARRRAPAALAAWAAYGIALAPVLGFFQVWTYVAADRYSYLACLGLALLAGAALGRLAPARGAILGGALLALLAALTARQIPVWRDSESLWRHAVAVNRDSHMAQYNLGVALAREGRVAEARAAYEEALRARPRYAEALAGLGALDLAEGRPEEAAARLRDALAAWPTNGEALANLGIALARTGKRDEALAAYDAARRLRPDLPEVLVNRAALLLDAGRAREAIADLDEAVRLRPDHADAWRNLGVARERTGAFAAAADAFEEAARLRPADADLLRSAAAARLRAGQDRLALEAARAALRVRPGDAAAANIAAWILATSPDAGARDGAEAVRLAEGALAAAGPEPDPNLLDTFAAALAEAGRFEEAARAAADAAGRARARGDSTLASEVEARQHLYERRQPFRLR
jgi:tetratricopeptide (TPR) repeat protein